LKLLMLPVSEGPDGVVKTVRRCCRCWKPGRESCPRCSHTYVYQTEYDCVAGDEAQILSGPKAGVSFQLGG